jgi:hypothetical protein
MTLLRIFLTALLAFAINACGGNDGDTTPAPTPPPAQITISLSTATPGIQAGQTAQFQATLTGTTNTQVTYSVEGGNDNGSITSAGLYQAPARAGIFSVRATSAADPAQSATASVTVTAPPVTAITISPTNPTVTAGGTVSFSANAAATFSVAGGDANGMVSATGTGNANYTAPATPGTYQVVATSTADANQRATATVTVSAGSGFLVSSNVRVAPGATTQLSASLNNQPVTATWAIVGSCTGCSVNASGLFTAGSTVQSVTVRGSNPANTAQSATVVVTIASEVILTLFAPTAPTLTAADMLTFNPSVSPEGIDRSVSWTTGPGATAGSVIAVDYFHGWLPPAAPGAYTITATSVADPSKTASIAAQVTAAPAVALVATAGAPTSMRYDHAAAAMADGRVVLVGGLRDRQGFTPPLGTDVFNPVTGTFSTGPSLAVDRVRAEAVAIDADRVLVTGGQEDYQTARNTAELLNLATGSTTATINTMGAQRIHHRMVRLTTGANSGKVLVMGGFNGPVPYGVPTWMATSTVDLFDPATNMFTASTATLNTARGLFTATALNDGRILIVGGIAPSPGAGALASAEIYNPATGTFTFTGSMSVARFGHTATRLPDGKVLVAGGDSNVTRSTAELFDPATGTFTALASRLAVARINHAAASLADGRVLVFGGESGDFFVRGTVEAYDPATQTFSLYARMGTARVRATASTLTAGPNSGKVLVFGGGAANTVQTAAELTP